MQDNNMINTVIDWLVSRFGYITVIKIKDILLFLSGISAGQLLMVALVSRFFYRVRKVEDLGKVTSVMFKHEGKKHYFTRVGTFHQAMEFIILVTYLPFFRKKEYMIEDEKRTKRFAYSMLVVTALLVLIGLLLACHPIVRPELLPIELSK